MFDERSPDQASRRVPCASAFLTRDCEIPNCLAIADGLTPALKAARTAFSLPVVNEPGPSWAASWRRCGFASATGFSFAGLGGHRPRRSASVVTAASSASISTSSNRLSAPAKSFGKKWRCCAAKLSGPALPFGTAEGPAVVTVGRAENRSGVVSAGRRVGMPPTMPPVAHRGKPCRPARTDAIQRDRGALPRHRAGARWFKFDVKAHLFRLGLHGRDHLREALKRCSMNL
jgi:hypothetical protein